jgi:sugar lactone lactonase YvrE
MSDFRTELRREVFEAHARHRRRAPLRRRLVGARPRRVLAPVLAAAAVAIAILVIRLPARPAPAKPPRIQAVVHVGGQPIGAALGDGSLWVVDSSGSVVRVDPHSGRVIARIPVAGTPDAVAAGAGSVWVSSESGGGRSRLLRIDPHTNRVSLNVSPGAGITGSPTLAVGAGGLWVMRDVPEQAIYRLDPAGLRVITRIGPFPTGHGLVATANAVWAEVSNGTLLHIDAQGRIVRRWPQLLLGGHAGGKLAADARGVWVVNDERSELIRIEADRIVRRIGLPAPTLPLAAGTPDAVWAAAGDDLNPHNRLLRIDPASGRVTGSVDLGHRVPTALTAVGAQVAVTTGNGDLLLIS